MCCNFHEGHGSHTHCIEVLGIQTSLHFSGSSVLWCFEHSSMIKVCDGIMVDFYLGLPHVQWIMHGSLGFMVNNHPIPRAEPKDKGGYCKP